MAFEVIPEVEESNWLEKAWILATGCSKIYKNELQKYSQGLNIIFKDTKTIRKGLIYIKEVFISFSWFLQYLYIPLEVISSD